MDEVDIILAAYNGEKYIAEQLKSILMSDYSEIKIWVFDDCSSDNTKNIIEAMSSEYPGKIKYICNDNRKGGSKSFLNGLIYARNHKEDTESRVYYMFSDQDDFWLPNKISLSLSAIKRVENIGKQHKPSLVFTDAYVTDEKLNIIAESYFSQVRLNTSKTDLAHLLAENKCIGCTTIFNDELAAYIKTVPEMLRFHDWWMALAASAFGNIVYYNVKTIKYRQHSDNVVGSVDFNNYVINRIKKIKEVDRVLKDTYSQAGQFFKYYSSYMNESQKEVVSMYAQMQKKYFLQKRAAIIKYGFWRSGIIRNIGLMILS